MEMMRPSSIPPMATAPVMPIRPLNLSCHFLGRNRIRIQQRSGFSTLGRTGPNKKYANNQDAEYCLDVHRRLPPLDYRGSEVLRLLPRFHDAGLVTFCPITRRTEIKSSGSSYCKRGQRPEYPQQHLDDSIGIRLHSIADIVLSATLDLGQWMLLPTHLGWVICPCDTFSLKNSTATKSAKMHAANRASVGISWRERPKPSHFRTMSSPNMVRVRANRFITSAADT
jgi:hypothetical protein